MKTIQLTDAQAKRLIADLANKWAFAATHAAIDDTAKILNDPSNYYGLAKRRQWFVEKRSDAALYSKLLWQFGIETPPVDTTAYVTPMSERGIKVYGIRWRNGFEYLERRRLYVAKCLIATITGGPMPPPPDRDVEIASQVLAAMNGLVRKELSK